jgi:hypothetical protein
LVYLTYCAILSVWIFDILCNLVCYQDDEDELADLQKTGDMPIEELLKSLPQEVLDAPAPLTPLYQDQGQEEEEEEGEEEEEKDDKVGGLDVCNWPGIAEEHVQSCSHRARGPYAKVKA